MNFEKWAYHSSKIPVDYLERTNFFNKLEKDIEEEIRNNPEKYGRFYEGYDPNSIDNFITQYVKHKRNLIENYEWHLSRLESNKELRYRQKTEEIFDMIKQKKLFNQQLLWRAEQLELPDVDICAHFTYWEHHIEKCPFLDPVTEADVQVMKQFLRTQNYDTSEDCYFCHFLRYDDLMSQNEEGDYEDMPEWYQYYDSIMGTGSLLLLPNIRGEKEEEYIRVANAKRRKELEENPPGFEPFVPPPPILNAYHEELARFVNTFEDEYLQRISLGYEKIFKEEERPFTPSYDIEQIEDAVQLLDEADYPVIMPGGLDWREAIMRCARQYINNIIADELDIVFAEYEMFSTMGIGHTVSDCRAEYRNDYICTAWEELVLEGRELSGEPRNFDF